MKNSLTEVKKPRPASATATACQARLLAAVSAGKRLAVIGKTLTNDVEDLAGCTGGRGEVGRHAGEVFHNVGRHVDDLTEPEGEQLGRRWHGDGPFHDKVRAPRPAAGPESDLLVIRRTARGLDLKRGRSSWPSAGPGSRSGNSADRPSCVRGQGFGQRAHNLAKPPVDAPDAGANADQCWRCAWRMVWPGRAAVMWPNPPLAKCPATLRQVTRTRPF